MKAKLKAYILTAYVYGIGAVCGLVVAYYFGTIILQAADILPR